MTYLRTPHRCDLPLAHIHGQVWQCDDCKRVWRASVPGNPEYATWRRLGRFGRWIFGVARRPAA